MNTVVVVVIIWLVLSLLVGMFLGRVIAFGESGEVSDPAPTTAAPERQPARAA
jgi:hypothetical protein